MDKLGQGFTSADLLEEVDIRDGQETSITRVINPQNEKLASSTLRNKQYHNTNNKI